MERRRGHGEKEGIESTRVSSFKFSTVSNFATVEKEGKNQVVA